MTLEAIRYTPSPASLQVLDQLRLPHETVYVDVGTSEDAFRAIKSMQVRGAPAIAMVAIMAIVVEAARLGIDGENSNGEALNGGVPNDENINGKDQPRESSQKWTASPATGLAMQEWYQQRLRYLLGSRPTAVNLRDAVDKLEAVLQQAAEQGQDQQALRQTFQREAERMLAHDVLDNQNIGRHGAQWISSQAAASSLPVSILTHCNTGSLATAGYGTALGIVRALHETGRLHHVFYTETRPYNQGSRLTGYELLHDRIPATLVTDSMAAALMQLRRHNDNIVAVVVGADRVAANGDTANKIGTYALAVLARHHGIKMVVAAPRTTIDLNTLSGKDIVIEERPAHEMLTVTGPSHHVAVKDNQNADKAGEKRSPNGDVNQHHAHESVKTQANGSATPGQATRQTISTAAQGTRAWNPAFDVTPAELIDAIVTEVGVAEKLDGKFDLAAIMTRGPEPAP